MATQKNKLRKEIIPSCNIHTVKEETLGRGPKDGGNMNGRPFNED